MDIAISRFSQTILDSLNTILGKDRGPGVLAVSGGADSVAMCWAFRELGTTENVAIAHMNHQLRGQESNDDADFVKRLAEGLPFHLGSADVQAIARENNENLEATARKLRYDFLRQSAHAQQARWVATAHTLDDQAETVLHRMIRGSGLRGLRGIAPVRPLGEGVVLVRPMLHLSRGDVIGYLQTISKTWREDSSNQQLAFTRNRIRQELLPLLKTFNPQITESLGRLAGQVQETYESIEQRIAQLLAAVELPRAGNHVIMDRSRCQSLKPEDLRELLRSIWEREHWPTQAMTHEHWKRAADVALGEITASDMPEGIHIRGTGRVVRIGPTS